MVANTSELVTQRDEYRTHKHEPDGHGKRRRGEDEECGGSYQRGSCERHKHLTRPEISDCWRGRAWLRLRCGSHRKLECGAASGSLHRLVRPWRREGSPVTHLLRDSSCMSASVALGRSR